MVNRWGKRLVSTTESFLSTFGFLCTFLGLYILTNILIFLQAAVEEAKRHQDFQRYVTAISRGCGATLNFNMAVVLLVASRSLVGLLRETPLNMVLPLDKAMPEFHKVVGMFLVVAGILHSSTHWVTYLIKSPWSGGYSGATSLFVSGMLLLILILSIRIAARPAIYKSNYEAFYRIHVGGGVAAFITIMIHGLHRGVPSSWKWVVGPVIIYVLDVSLRAFREKRSYLLVSKHSAVFQGPDILKIRLPRILHFVAGQYAELKVPELSRFQWHPFTIASAPHEPEMVFYIKAVGDWTISLYQLFSERIREGGCDIEVHIRGPFGAPAQHVGQFDRVIVIGGGVGATPFCSIVKDAHNWMTNWTPRGKQQQSNRTTLVTIGDESSLRRNQTDYSEIRPVQTDGRIQPGECGSAEGNQDAQHSGFISDPDNSHIFTTNVYSEPLDITDIEIAEDNHDRAVRELFDVNDGRSRVRTSQLLAIPNAKAVESVYIGAAATSGLYTARDYLSSYVQGFSKSGSSQESFADQGAKLERNEVHPSPFEDRMSTEPQIGDSTFSKPSIRKNRKKAVRRPQEYEDEGMGSYHANSTGSTRQSLEFMGALYSAYSMQETNEIYQKSLDMMVSLRFGSASLVRTMQMRQAQRNVRNVRVESRSHLPLTVDTEDLSIFHNPRVMFILFMRSVTVNMILLWVMLIRFVVAGTAYIFDGLQIFENGFSLYKSPVLTGIDLVLVIVISLLVGIPSVLEIVELGAIPVHGFDLFVLTPAALFGIVADVLALIKVGPEVELFGVVHIFVLWPILGILIMIRLLRVIGERISQVETLTHTHSTTKAVDFYWTAPSPDDDRWLVNELTPYANLPSVQLHRYLTRCIAPDEAGPPRKRTHTPSLHTNFGRPKWNEIFNETSEASKNNTTIGVFFCGPVSMGEDVQHACMDAMRNSIVRGLQCSAGAMRGLEAVFGEAVSANKYTGDATEDRNDTGKRGCNVKFVFKRETFA